MFQQIELGTTLKPIAIERYKASENHQDVIAVVSRKIGGVQMHYREGIGFFYCFGGQCCEDLGLAQVRYILPVLVYSGLRDIRRRDYGLPVTMKYMALGRDAYESQILTKEQINSNLHGQDLLVTCTDEQYQKLTFDVVGPNKWRGDELIKKEVQTLWAEYQRLIGMSVARKLTPEKYRELCEKSDEAKGKKDRVPPERQRQPTPDAATHSLQLNSGANSSDLELGTSSPEQPVITAGNDLLDDPTPAKTPEKGATMKTAAPTASPKNVTATPAPTAGSFDDLIDAPPGAPKP